MAGRKLEHLNEEIRHKLGQLLVKDVGDPRFRAVTITEVRVARDLAIAHVKFASYMSDVDHDELAASLNHAAGYLTHLLSRHLHTRRTPRLHFHYDPGFEYAQHIDEVLRQVVPPEAAAEESTEQGTDEGTDQGTGETTDE